MVENIFKDWITVLEGSTGKRIANIYKENDGHKNIYTITLKIRNMTPESESELTFYTKRNAMRLADTFLDTDREKFYWSESIVDFLNEYFQNN